VLDASGARLRRASGFFVSPELVSTSFAGLNGARRARLVMPDGRRLETDGVAGWSRRDDWALLRFPGAGGEPPAPASQPPQVGDRGYFLDLQGGSSRVIAETAFIGQSPEGDFRLGSLASEESLGAPVLNEYGEIAAALAGSGIPGAGPVDQAALADAGYDVARGSRARAPVSASDATSLSETFESLAQAGAFVKPLVRSPHIVDGALDTEASRSLRVPTWIERRFRFTRADRCVVSVRWIPDQKQDTTSRFEVFDAGNRRVGASDPAKLKLRPGQPLLQSWEIALTTLPAGLYRVDLVLGDADPVWRSYFHLTE
jgi:hypothetical protein